MVAPIGEAIEFRNTLVSSQVQMDSRGLRYIAGLAASSSGHPPPIGVL